MIWFVVPQYRLHITERDPPHRIEWLRRRVRCRSHGASGLSILNFWRETFSLLKQPPPRSQYERVVVVDVEVPEASGVTVVVELLAGSRTVSA
jgi:hypothetical protein